MTELEMFKEYKQTLIDNIKAMKFDERLSYMAAAVRNMQSDEVTVSQHGAIQLDVLASVIDAEFG